MNIRINSLKFKTDKKLDLFIEDKVSKLNGYFDGVISADVTLKVDKSDAVENKIAEIRLQIPGNDLFAKKKFKTFEEAVDESCGALKKQLIRYKEKVRKK